MRAVSALLLLLAPLALAGPKVPELKPALEDFQLPTRDICFPSGMRVVFQADPSSPTVSVLSRIDGGSSQDPAGIDGLAHALEHLSYRARPQGGPSLQQRLEAMGASFNAATLTDTTTFASLVPKGQLTMAMRFETLRLEDPLVGVTEADIALERRVIENERQENALSRLVLGTLMSSLYPASHPYGRGQGERAESLGKVNLAALKTAAAAWYRPENTTLVVVGDLDLAGADAVLNQAVPDSVFYGAAGPKGTPRACAPRMTGTPAEPPAPTRTTMGTIRSNVALPHAYVAWSLPAAVSNDLVHDELLAELTSAWLNFRLWSSQRTQTSEDRAATCEAIGGRQGAQILCSWTLQSGQDLDTSISRAVDEVAHLWDKGGRDWLTQATERHRRDAGLDTLLLLERSPEVLGGRPLALVDTAHELGTAAFLGARLKALDDVQVTELMTRGARYITGPRAARLGVLPTAASALLAGQSSASDALPRASSGAPEAAAPTADLRALVVAPDLSKLREAKLSNGVRVVVVPSGAAPLVQSWLWFPDAGDPGLPGLADLSARTLDLFPEVQRLGPALLDMPRELLSGWRRWFTEAGDIVGDVGPAGNLEQHLYMLSELVTDMAPSPGNRRATLDHLRERAAASQTSAVRREARLGRAAVAPGRPSRWLLSPQEVARLEAIPAGDVDQRIKAVYQPSNTTLFIVGKVNPDAAVKLAETWLGRWKASAPPLPAPPAAGAPGPRQVLLLNEPGAQTLVTLRCPAGGASGGAAVDGVAIDVLAESWRRTGELALRQQQGASYGVHSSTERIDAASSILTLQAVVESGRAVDAARLFLELPHRTVGAGLDPEVVRTATAEVAAGTALRQVDHESLGWWLLETARLGQPWSTMSGVADPIAAVDAPRLASVAGICDGHEVLTLVGPADALGPALSAAGIQFTQP